MVRNLLVDSVREFACRLYTMLEKDKNLFFSPHSVSAAMSLAYAGAKGETALQMAKALAYPAGSQEMITRLLMSLAKAPEDGKISLSAANSAWLQKDFPILEEYRQKLGAMIRETDFAAASAAAGEINAWIEENTNNLIKDLVSPDALGALTRLVLVNAIHFKGAWTKAFDPARTYRSNFHCLDGTTAKVDMMFAKEMDARMVSDHSCQVIRLPYGDGSIHMLVILPKDFRSYSLGFDGRELERIQLELDNTYEDEVDVRLPKFKSESTLSLGETLKNLGAKDAFDPAVADFSGITGSRDLFISAVLHKAVVDVSEEGTEAAAATAVVMRRLCCCRMDKRFTVDKPFIFAICEKGGAPLFMGRIVSL